MSRPTATRRTFLRGLGALVALPALEVSLPARAVATTPPRRAVFLHLPNGMMPEHFVPDVVGPDWTPRSVLSPLARHKADLLVLSGTANIDLRDEADDHGALLSSLLTGDRIIRGVAGGPTQGKSADVLIAEALAGQTPYPSLELTSEGTIPCYDIPDCFYRQNLSWTSPTQPAPRELDPFALFQRLFGDAAPGVSAAQAQARKHRDLLVVDAVMEDAARLDARLGQADRARLDSFMTGLFEIEHALQSGALDATCSEAVNVVLPAEALVPPFPVETHARLMLELLALALHCDLVRVGSWMLANEISRRQFPWLGVPFQHHATSHHLGRPDRIQDLEAIGTWEYGLVADFLDRLASLEAADGSRLLDHTVVMTACAMGDPNAHDPTNLPILLAGQAGGAVRTGRHIALPGRPVADVVLSVVQAMGLTGITQLGAEGRTPVDLT